MNMSPYRPTLPVIGDSIASREGSFFVSSDLGMFGTWVRSSVLAIDVPEWKGFIALGVTVGQLIIVVEIIPIHACLGFESDLLSRSIKLYLSPGAAKHEDMERTLTREWVFEAGDSVTAAAARLADLAKAYDPKASQWDQPTPEEADAAHDACQCQCGKAEPPAGGAEAKPHPGGVHAASRSAAVARARGASRSRPGGAPGSPAASAVATGAAGSRRAPSADGAAPRSYSVPAVPSAALAAASARRRSGPAARSDHV